jgi:hypothetical protein
MGHPNSKKHKAMHGGYKERPSKRAVNALCDMYAAIGEIKFSDTPEKASIPPGTQLSLNL